MGYLDQGVISVDAILTKKGRALLAQGAGLGITQFALADDEVDYTLYDTGHPLGSAYYGNTIEKMPVLEASPDETQIMKYRLVTMGRGATTIPVVSANTPNIALTYSKTSNPFSTITPTTLNGLNGSGYGYTAILYDSTAAELTGIGITTSATTPFLTSDQIAATATVVRGTSFEVRPKDVRVETLTTIVIIGNQTGGTATVPVVITPETTA